MSKEAKKPRKCDYHLCSEKSDSLKECKHCGGYFCKEHISPRLALSMQSFTKEKDPVLSMFFEKEWRRNDGHPCMPYSDDKIAEIKEKDKESYDKLFEALDKMKGKDIIIPVIKQPERREKTHRKLPFWRDLSLERPDVDDEEVKERPKIPMKLIAAGLIILIIIVGVYFYKPTLYTDGFSKLMTFANSLNTNHSSGLPQSIQPITQNPIIPKSYDVKITSVETLPNCTSSMFSSPPYVIYHDCTLVNLEITSYSSNSFNIFLNKYAIVLSDGSQIGIMQNYQTVGYYSRCFGSLSYTGQTVYPGAKQNIGLCFPSVSSSDSPKFYTGFLYNYKIDYNSGEISGDQKDYSFDLSPYLTGISIPAQKTESNLVSNKTIALVSANCTGSPNTVRFSVKNTGNSAISSGDLMAYLDDKIIITNPNMMVYGLLVGQTSQEYIFNTVDTKSYRTLKVKTPTDSIEYTMGCEQ